MPENELQICVIFVVRRQVMPLNARKIFFFDHESTGYSILKIIAKAEFFYAFNHREHKGRHREHREMQEYLLTTENIKEDAESTEKCRNIY